MYIILIQNLETPSASIAWKFTGTLGIGKQQCSEFKMTIDLYDININQHFSTSSQIDCQTKS